MCEKYYRYVGASGGKIYCLECNSYDIARIKIEDLAPEMPIELYVYEWHELLGILEYRMQIVNMDVELPAKLYERIATQLNGKPVKVVRREPLPETKSEKPKSFIKRFLVEGG
jgi:hypothetical protein